MLSQELHDLAQATQLFPGDALCFATLACLGAHLPYVLRGPALHQARETARRLGVPVSHSVYGDGAWYNVEPAKGPEEKREKAGEPQMTTFLDVERYRGENFATGVLTNVSQVQSWVCPCHSVVEEDGDDSADDSDDGREGGDQRGKNASALPFHPAFVDAAMLTLSTPKWPLLVDPEGIALR